MPKTFYLTIFLVLLSFGAVFSLQAADYTLLEPGIAGQEKGTIAPNDFGEYASWFYRLLLAVTIALSIIQIVLGGFQYLWTSTGLGKAEGKDKIRAALTGLIIALLSWLILYTINPDLVDWKFCMPNVSDIANSECLKK